MKFVKFLFMFIILVIIIFYAFLWLSSIKKYPVDYGISFSEEHAAFLGLEWKETYKKMLAELKPKYIRIAAAWNYVEKDNNNFDFSKVDFMMDEANKAGAKVTLVIGQKAPRWPECYVPDWASKLGDKEFSESLNNYIETTVKRYKDNSALEYWQVENEPFIAFHFGECANFHANLVDDEVKLVNYLDQPHWTIITDSGELSFWKKAGKLGDLFGTTIYRIVRTPKGLVWSYDWLPASFYRYKAKLMGIHLERMYVSELQAEPWFTGEGPHKTPLEAQYKTMNLKRLEKHTDFVEKIGVSRAYLWGVEWWYWMAEKHGDNSYVEYVKELMKK